VKDRFVHCCVGDFRARELARSADSDFWNIANEVS